MSAKDLRFKISMIFDMLSKGEKITITYSYRGKPKARIIPIKQSKKSREEIVFGLWKDRDIDPKDYVIERRKGRVFE